MVSCPHANTMFLIDGNKQNGIEINFDVKYLQVNDYKTLTSGKYISAKSFNFS